MFEFEDHHFLEEQLLKAAADPGVPLRGDHRDQVLDAARQARSRQVRRRSLAALSLCCVVVGTYVLSRDSRPASAVAIEQAPEWPATFDGRGSHVLGVTAPKTRADVFQTDWNSVQATLKQSGEWGLVDAVVRFRNERAGTIEQIFDRGD